MSVRLDRLLSLSDFEAAARDFLPAAVFGFVQGGTEDGVTVAANRDAFGQLAFRPRGLMGVARRTQQVQLWGRTYASPFGIAPMGVTSICRHECDLALARAAARRDVPFVLSGLSNVPMEKLREQGAPFWYQAYLPGDLKRIEPLLQRLSDAGVEVLAVTIDTAVGSNRENNLRAGFTIPFRLSRRLMLDGIRHPRWTMSVFARALLAGGIPRFTNASPDPRGWRITEEPKGGFRQGRELLTWEHLKWIRDRWRGWLVVKGVLHPKDARLAVEHGLDGVIVSNHGGRQLDGAISSLRALPEVIRAVPAHYPVLIDGGFRRGSDVLKAVALGAQMVLIGRPMLYGAAVAGAAGVERVIEVLSREIDIDLALLGCPRIEELDRDVLAMQH